MVSINSGLMFDIYIYSGDWRRLEETEDKNTNSNERSCSSLSSEPEPGPEVVRAGEEGSLGGRVNQPPHWAVVAERQELFPAGVPGVPGTQTGRGLVRKHDEVLALVKNCLRLELLFARGAGPSVGDQTATGGELPQLHQGVLQEDNTGLSTP